MFYMDKNTFRIYDQLSENENENDFFEVDELIAPIIRILNLKGYLTEFCCSGHFDPIDEDEQYPATYIAFKAGIIIPSYPKNASFELTDQLMDGNLRCTIRYREFINNYDDDYYHNYYHIYDIILGVMREWLDWAINLPEYNKLESLKSLFSILE